MSTFFQSNPGLSSRDAHHLDFPDHAHEELLQIGDKMLVDMNYRFDAEARDDLSTLTASDIRNSRVFGADGASASNTP